MRLTPCQLESPSRWLRRAVFLVWAFRNKSTITKFTGTHLLPYGVLGGEAIVQSTRSVTTTKATIGHYSFCSSSSPIRLNYYFRFSTFCKCPKTSRGAPRKLRTRLIYGKVQWPPNVHASLQRVERIRSPTKRSSRHISLRRSAFDLLPPITIHICHPASSNLNPLTLAYISSVLPCPTNHHLRPDWWHQLRPNQSVNWLLPNRNYLRYCSRWHYATGSHCHWRLPTVRIRYATCG